MQDKRPSLYALAPGGWTGMVPAEQASRMMNRERCVQRGLHYERSA